MKGNRTVLLGLVVGIAGAVLLGVYVYAGAGSAGADAEPTVEVLVAAADLPANTRADELGERVRTVAAPESFVPERRVTDLEALHGQRVLRTVGSGEILTFDQFGAAGPAAGGVVVAENYEAVSVEATPARGVEGYVTPGARVNVYAIMTEQVIDPETGGERSRTFTQLVLGHVEVLAVTRGTLTGEAREPGTDSPDRQIVLLMQVRPEDAPVLVHAETQGELWFSLVNADDPAPSSTRVTIDDFDPDRRSEAVRQAVERQAREDAAEDAEVQG